MKNFLKFCGAITTGGTFVTLGYWIMGHQSSAAFELGLACFVFALLQAALWARA